MRTLVASRGKWRLPTKKKKTIPRLFSSNVLVMAPRAVVGRAFLTSRNVFVVGYGSVVPISIPMSSPEKRVFSGRSYGLDTQDCWPTPLGISLILATQFSSRFRKVGSYDKEREHCFKFGPCARPFRFRMRIVRSTVLTVQLGDPHRASRMPGGWVVRFPLLF